MTATGTHKLSIFGALAFGLWMVWMLWPQRDVPVQKAMKMPEEPVVQQQTVTETPIQKTAQVFELPQPPMPPKVIEVAQVAQVEETLDKKAVEVQEKSAPAPVPEVKKEIAPSPVVTEKAQPLKPQAQPAPVPAPEPIKTQEPDVQEVSVTQTAGGRALLRVLEHGKGPLIEIAWPKENRLRDQMFDYFRECYGMENALMDRSGDLFRTEDARGQRWEINMDRYSGFLRQVAGRIPAAEDRIRRAILRKHSRINAPVVVRIFPRAVDASLLGGLKAIVGEGYMNAGSIQAQYILENGRVIVGQIRKDGQVITGRIALSQIRRCSGRA